MEIRLCSCSPPLMNLISHLSIHSLLPNNTPRALSTALCRNTKSNTLSGFVLHTHRCSIQPHFDSFTPGCSPSVWTDWWKSPTLELVSNTATLNSACLRNHPRSLSRWLVQKSNPKYVWMRVTDKQRDDPFREEPVREAAGCKSHSTLLWFGSENQSWAHFSQSADGCT